MRGKNVESGQIAVILALAMVGLLAFTALAIDGGNMYLQKRNAQNAADAGAIAGTREVHRILHLDPDDAEYPADPDTELRAEINEFVQSNGVPDTAEDASGVVNDNIQVFYLDVNGDPIGSVEVGSVGYVPSESRGIGVEASIPFDTFLAGLIGRPNAQATATAGAVYEQESSTYLSALYAIGTCIPQTLDLTGSYQEVNGGIHSNANLSIQGSTANPSQITGTVEAVGDIAYSGVDFITEGQPSPCELGEFGVSFSYEDYLPGTDKALDAQAVGMYYIYEDNGNATAPEPWQVDGLHVSRDPDGFTIPSNFPTEPGLEISLVAKGPIKVQADTVLKAYVDGILLFSTYGDRNCPSNKTAISLSGNQFNWEGLIYAPNGHVDISASSNSTLYGLIVAWTINLSGSYMQVLYNPVYDPPPPPVVILVW